MAVHLKMDFRVVELTGNINVLQCNRGSESCLWEVEYNTKLGGALVQAIHKMKLHTCESPVVSQPKSARPVLPLYTRKLSTVSNG
jgi:hypothetical protein